MPSGEDFILEDLPIGTRVLYPNPPIKGLPNREAAIRYALNHPHDCDPLFAQLEPGMRVTVAVDDISLPLPRWQHLTFAKLFLRSCWTCFPDTV